MNLKINKKQEYQMVEKDKCGTTWIAVKVIHSMPNFEIVTLLGSWAGLSIIRKVN